MDASMHNMHQHNKHICQRCGEVFATKDGVVGISKPLSSLPTLQLVAEKVGLDEAEVQG